MSNGLFLAGIVAIGALLVYLQIRNSKAQALCTSMLDRIGELAFQDVISGRAGVWRFDEFQKVPYERMVFQFWKPLKAENYWSDLSFLSGEETKH